GSRVPLVQSVRTYAVDATLHTAHLLFPYTTLFRSPLHERAVTEAADEQCRRGDAEGARPQRTLDDGPAAHAGDEDTREHRQPDEDRKSTRLNSSHGSTAYTVFCFEKKNSTVESRAF